MKYRLCKYCKQRLYRVDDKWIKPTCVDQYYLPKGNKLKFRYFCKFECWLSWHVPEEVNPEIKISLVDKIKIFLRKLFK